MTEAEWLACNDPKAMLELLRGKASDRKLRLFAVVCCRRIWPLLADVMARDAAEVAERFADGLVGDQIRSDARKAARQGAQVRGVTAGPRAPKWERRAASAVYYAAAREAMEAAWNAPQLAVEALIWRAGGYSACDSRAVRKGEEAHQAHALYCICGNPFRPASIAASWLAWNDGAIGKMAQAIYDARAFDRLPLLADALEEAGCADAAILAHCRQAGEHVRGCWVVDLLLGKT